MKKTMVRKGLTASALLGLSIVSSMGYAAEGFKVRFPLSGSLGGEMVAPITPGVFGSVVVTSIDIDKITGNDGNSMTGVKAGTFATGLAPGLGTMHYSGIVNLGFNQKQELYNLYLGYTTPQTYADGHLTFAINIPYAAIDRKAVGTGTSPTLYTAGGTNINTLGAGPIAVQNGFNTAYQSGLTALGASASGQVTGLGDVEITGLWSRQTEKTKLALGVTLVAPTGDYDAASTAINVGYGKFYTLRTGAAMAYKAAENLTLGGKVSLAFNSKNTANNWRSGDFYAIDLAAAYRTPIGVVGPHFIHVQQYKDDVGSISITGGTLGSNRFSSTGAGVFFTTLIPGLNAGLNLSYMKTLESKNSLSGSFIQARLSKVF